MSLLLELRAGDHLLINGSLLEMRTRARLDLLTQADFVFGKQWMDAWAATTPARRFYRSVQEAYAGPLLRRCEAMEEAARTAPLVGGEHVMQLLADGQSYRALFAARLLIRLEDRREAA